MSSYEKFEELAVSDFYRVANIYELRKENLNSEKEFLKALDTLHHSIEVMLMEMKA